VRSASLGPPLHASSWLSSSSAGQGDHMSDGQLLGLLCLLGVLVAALAVESYWNRRAQKSIPIRIHVNGTRGKSSVTRLIAAGLRAAGKRVAAKTTGTLPRYLSPSGTEEPIFRVGRANIAEQISFMRRAARDRADAVVVECMALQPFLQWVSTASIVRPTHGVVTNIREDHLDVMGPTLSGVALALLGTVPLGGSFFSAERRYSKLAAHVAEERGSKLLIVRPEDAEERVTSRDLRRFRYIEHAENVQLALAVCEAVGVPRGTALRGMQGARPDPGALTIEYVRVDGVPLVFVNGFAANDPESTGQVWELGLERTDSGVRRVALINCRSDRADRSEQLGRAAGTWTLADQYLVIGSGRQFFIHAAERAGIPSDRLLSSESSTATALAGELARLAGPGGVVVGLGNIGGIGLELIAKLRQKDGA
jgi:gamma-polyglutamate synthase